MRTDGPEQGRIIDDELTTVRTNDDGIGIGRRWAAELARRPR